MRHADIILGEIISNPNHLSEYQTGIEHLYKSRIFEYLRAAFVPVIPNGGANVHQTAAQASFSAGYNKCLDDILTFREEVVLIVNRKKSPIRADFGAADIALNSKHLTQEEIDAIARGETPRYDPKTGKLATKPAT